MVGDGLQEATVHDMERDAKEGEIGDVVQVADRPVGRGMHDNKEGGKVGETDVIDGGAAVGNRGVDDIVQHVLEWEDVQVDHIVVVIVVVDLDVVVGVGSIRVRDEDLAWPELLEGIANMTGVMQKLSLGDQRRVVAGGAGELDDAKWGVL